MLVFIAVSLEVIRNGNMNQIKISVNFNNGSSFSFETWNQIYLEVHPVEDKTLGNIVITIVILVKILKSPGCLRFGPFGIGDEVYGVAIMWSLTHQQRYQGSEMGFYFYFYLLLLFF